MNDTTKDAVQLLTHQHRDMESLLAKTAEAETDEEKKTLFTEAADLLTVHIKSEEQVFYPAVHAARTEDDLLESLEEHLSLKRLLADLLELEPSHRSFEPKFKVLKEQTEHHHKEEEEHLFPAVLKLLDAEQRETLGQEMLDMQAEMNLQARPRGVISSETATAAPLG
jgi:hypothetical protein